MEKKAKLGWSALRIIGTIYTGLGGFFLALGVSLIVLLPDEARLVGMIFTPLGGVLFVLGVIFLAIEGWKKRRMDALVEAGRFVWAEIIDSTCNYNVQVGSRHPYQLIARYTDGRGVNHLFRSQNVYSCGAADLVGKTVKVYVDENYKHYYVDAEPLLGSYIEH